MRIGLSCVAAGSDQACKTDALVGSSDEACLSSASSLPMWAAAVRSPAKIVGKTDRNNRETASGRRSFYEQC
jgi:hypothetical protein